MTHPDEDSAAEVLPRTVEQTLDEYAATVNDTVDRLLATIREQREEIARLKKDRESDSPWYDEHEGDTP